MTAGVDVQDDRLECEVVGWGADEESWGIYYKVFIGNPVETHVWNQLERFLDTEFTYSNGQKIKIICTCIDTGGNHTMSTYGFVKPREIKRIFGVKGGSVEGKPFITRPTKTNKGQISLFVLNTDTGKETIMARLRIDFPGPRYMHFPDNAERGYDETYFKGLTAEVKITTFEKGVRKTKWVVTGTKRNEPLDIRNYAYAALKIANPDLSKKYLIDVTERPKVQTKRKILSKGI